MFFVFVSKIVFPIFGPPYVLIIVAVLPFRRPVGVAGIPRVFMRKFDGWYLYAKFGVRVVSKKFLSIAGKLYHQIG